jgi:hypothetical protein
MDTAPMHRRSFLGRIAITTGGGLVTALLPASLLHAAATPNRIFACVATPPRPDSCGDWSVDDICSAYPGYTYDMNAGRSSRPSRVAHVADVDQMWVA